MSALPTQLSNIDMILSHVKVTLTINKYTHSNTVVYKFNNISIRFKPCILQIEALYSQSFGFVKIFTKK